MIKVEHRENGLNKETVFRTQNNKHFTAGELKTILNQLPEEFKDAEVRIQECDNDYKVRTIVFRNEKIPTLDGDFDFDFRRYTIHLFGCAIFRGGTITDAYTLES